MRHPLVGLDILVPESRELDLFAGMLEAAGAAVRRCPLVTILDLDETSVAEDWIEQLVSGGFDDVIWLTGEGLRRLLAVCDGNGRRQAFIDALGQVRSIPRGPKPARVLREIGLSSGLDVVTPTSQGVLDALRIEDISNRRIGVQLYPGEGGLPLVKALEDRGALVSSVTPYRYASQAHRSRVEDAIHALASGSIGMVAFTSSPQIDRLFEVARAADMEESLRRGFTLTLIAAVGPIVEETLHRYGLAADIRPDRSFHMKPLVRAITAVWHQRSGSAN
ncbi:uroporphyrinogen-III synthase [Emcibacter sp. SYSU 3D8]|uniref:uroporphyrinogen-III synthase n=1 Tax=Emcibacter sp. SYSU 3D8 TaxID=3133969 RepID=UPI0031FE55F4